MATTTLERSPVAQVCVACRFGRGDERLCVLLSERSRDRLLEEGPCQLSEWVRSETLTLIRRRYPFARSQEEDLASEVLLAVLDEGQGLLPEGIRHLAVLRARLRERIRSRTIDALRHHRLVARLRCGVCVHFATHPERGGCQLRTLPGRDGAGRANPHYGTKPATDADPRHLQPPCEGFEWRKPQTHDLFEECVPAAEEGTPRDRAAASLVEAIDRVSRQGEDGLRVAGVLFWHYLRGRGVRELAVEAAVSEKTIKRQLAEGRKRLLEVLTHEMGIEDPSDLA